MKIRRNLIQTCLLGATLLALPSMVQCQTPSPIVPLRLESSTNGMNLIVGSLSQTGALFLQTAADLHSLANNATGLFQTNSPLTNALLLNVAPPGGLPAQAFFSALLFAGQSVYDF